jgi:hypothetical protein
MRERLDDARAEPSFCLSKDAVRPADPVVSDRKLPIHPRGIISDGYATIAPVVGERMLQSVQHEFGRLTLLQSLKCVRLALWDEDQKRLVSFRELRRQYPSG